MAGITLAQAETQLSAWIDASTKVSLGQSYEISGRRLTRADSADIRASIEFWDKKVKELSASASGRGRAVTLAPRW